MRSHLSSTHAMAIRANLVSLRQCFLNRIRALPSVELVGVHSHLGSTHACEQTVFYCGSGSWTASARCPAWSWWACTATWAAPSRAWPSSATPPRSWSASCARFATRALTCATSTSAAAWASTTSTGAVRPPGAQRQGITYSQGSRNIGGGLGMDSRHWWSCSLMPSTRVYYNIRNPGHWRQPGQ